MFHPTVEPAKKICDLLRNGSNGKIDQEILIIDSESVAIVTDLDGVDYVLVMSKVPEQRSNNKTN